MRKESGNSKTLTKSEKKDRNHSRFSKTGAKEMEWKEFPSFLYNHDIYERNGKIVMYKIFQHKRGRIIQHPNGGEVNNGSDCPAVSVMTAYSPTKIPYWTGNFPYILKCSIHIPGKEEIEHIYESKLSGGMIMKENTDKGTYDFEFPNGGWKKNLRRIDRTFRFSEDTFYRVKDIMERAHEQTKKCGNKNEWTRRLGIYCWNMRVLADVFESNQNEDLQVG